MYRKKNGNLEVFLAHPGGAYFAGKDIGVWSIPKGEIDEGEDALATARREFGERRATTRCSTSCIIRVMSIHASPPVTNTQLVWLGVFGIAMGLLEAVVVVYLRELYFPGGFGFPLRIIPERMLRTETLRELSTLAILTTVAAVAAQKFILRFAIFLFTFGVWDIFYYVFLKALLDWPQSLFTWDVLFLIPVTWVGPVLAPVVCSLTMISLGLFFVQIDRAYENVRVERNAWLLTAAGAVLIFLSFVRDYAGIIINGGFYSDLAGLADNRTFQTAVASFVPAQFHWGLFGAGEMLILLSALTTYRRTTLTSGQPIH